MSHEDSYRAPYPAHRGGGHAPLAPPPMDLPLHKTSAGLPKYPTDIIIMKQPGLGMSLSASFLYHCIDNYMLIQQDILRVQ